MSPYQENPLAQERLSGYLRGESQRNPLVRVKLAPAVLDLACGQDSMAQAAALGFVVAGYAAGDMRAQLQAERPGDVPLAGAVGALLAYDYVRGELSPQPALPVLERWRQLRAQGTLSGHLDSLVAGLVSDCPQ